MDYSQKAIPVAITIPIPIIVISRGMSNATFLHLSSLQHLVELQLGMCERIEASTIMEFFTNSSSLRSLTLHQCAMACHASLSTNFRQITQSFEALQHRIEKRIARANTGASVHRNLQCEDRLTQIQSHLELFCRKHLRKALPLSRMLQGEGNNRRRRGNQLIVLARLPPS